MVAPTRRRQRAALALLATIMLAWRIDARMVAPLVAFAAVYAFTSVVEFLNYFYRGLSRSDVESTLIIGQRVTTLVLAVAVLLWRPDVTLLALAMLLPAAAAAALSARVAFRLQPADSASVEPRDGFLRDVLPIGAGSSCRPSISASTSSWSAVVGHRSGRALQRGLPAGRGAASVSGRGARGDAAVARAAPATCGRSRASLRRSPPSRSPSTRCCGSRPPADAVAVRGTLCAPPCRRSACSLLSFPLLSLNLALTHQLVGWDGSAPTRRFARWRLRSTSR